MTTLLILALALAMDAFAVALTHGAVAQRRPNVLDALRVGLAFGIAQALMPLIGWMLGLTFASVIASVDHWIAFLLLALIGACMIRAGLSAVPDMPAARSSLESGRALLIAALATSIDAAAAGVTLPLLKQPVFLACAIIGALTLVLSTAGVLVGAAAGTLIGRRAEIIGGLVLIGIGTKILLEHLFFGA